MKTQTAVVTESTTLTIAKKSATIFFFAAVATPIGYLMRILFSHSLTVEMFGLFYAVLGFIEIFIPFQDFGTGFSLTYFTPKLLRNKDEKAVWLLFVYGMIFRFFITLVISLLVVLNAEWLAQFYFKVAIAEQLLYLFALYLVINSVTNGFNQLFIGYQKEKYYASAEPLRLVLVVLLSSVVWYLHRADVLQYVVIWNIAYFCVFLYFAFLLIKKHPTLIRPISFEKEIFQKLFSFSVPLTASSLIYILTNQVGLIYLTYFHTVTEIGVYNVVLPIAGITTMFLTPLQNVFLPMVSEFMHVDTNKVRTLLENILRILPFTALYFNFFIFLFPQYTLGFLFSNKWLGSATIPLMIISLGYVFQTISGFVSVVADGMGLVKERMKLHIVGAFCNLTLGAVLIFKFGVIGLIVTNSIIFLILSVGIGRLIYARIPFKLPVLLYAKYGLLLLVIYSVVRVFNFSPSTWQSYILAGVIYTAVSVAFALWQDILEQHTKKQLLEYGRKRWLAFSR